MQSTAFSYAFYPAGAFAKAFNNNRLAFTIPDLQRPTATSFDKDADILVSKPYPITISNQSVVINDIRFARILSTLKVVVSDGTAEHLLTGDQIKSITLSTDMQNAALTGRIRWDFDNEVSDMTINKATVTADLSANPIAIGGAIYFLVNPTTLTSGSKLTVQITTDKHIITKVATLSKNFVFPAGQVANLGISIKDSDTIGGPVPEPTGTGWFLVQDVTWLKADDQVVIANAGSKKAIGTTQNTNNRSAVDVSLNSNGTLDIQSAMPFTLKAGTESGTFAFKDPSLNKYLYFPAGNNNYLKSGTLQKNASWKISINSSTTRIENAETSGRFIQYNYNQGNPIFATYTGSQTEVLIYKYYSGYPELGNLSISVTPDEENRTVTVTWDDLDNATNYEVTCTGQSVQDIEPGVQSAVFTDLAYDTEYTITVTATADGYMPASATETVSFSDPHAIVITALKESFSVEAAAATATETGVYELMNATDADLTVTTDGTVVTSASAASGNITYTVAENNSNFRYGWIKIAVAGGNEIEITVKQVAMSSPWSTVYTSNVTMAKGTTSYDNQSIVINGTSYNGIKVGTSSSGGSMTVTVPAHKTRLYIHIGAWNGESGSVVSISGNNGTPSPSSLTLWYSNGFKLTSPFTFAGDPSSSNFFRIITIPDSATQTTLTFTSEKRFIIWGCNVDDYVVVTTGGAKVKSSGSATLNGAFAGATGTVGASGFLLSETKSTVDNYGGTDIQLGSQTGTEGTLTYDLNGLVNSTTYYYRAYVQVWDEETHEYKTRYGEVRSFTTWEADTSVHLGWMELPAVTGNEDFVGEFFGSNNQRNYSYNYNYAHFGCLWVAYPLTSSHLTGSPSSNWALNPNIASDKQIWIADNSYGTHYNQGSGYDRGHQIPNADRKSDATMNAQTYYATNQTPQIGKGFNQDIWETLESAVRTEVNKATTDTVYVVTGACYRTVNGNETINQLQGVINPEKPTNPMLLDIPNYYWKALLKVSRDSDGNITGAQAVGFWFDHHNYGTASDYATYATSVDYIELMTGFDLFTNLPADLQATAEDNTSWTAFQNFVTTNAN